jgi:hypothetical protein
MSKAGFEKGKRFAEASSKTHKAREKLKRQLDAIDKKITPQALKKKTIEIHQWIERYASQRVSLKSKSICLFDENQNTANLSRRVVKLAEKLKKDIQPSQPDASWGEDRKISPKT